MKRMIAQTLIEKILALTDDKKFKIVSCVLRNYSGTWKLITEGDHLPINVKAVTQDETGITIEYPFTAKNVVSLLVTPDEDYAKKNIFCGASVGLSHSKIQIFQPAVAGGYIAYSGDAWNVNGNIVSADFEGGNLKVTHPADNGASEYAASVNKRNPNDYDPLLLSVGVTTTEIGFYDSDGNKVTTPDSNMKVYLNRGLFGKLVVPAFAPTDGNLWVLGIMEVE